MTVGPLYEVGSRRYAVWVSRYLNPGHDLWALYASTYKSEEEAEYAAVGALAAGYVLAEVRVSKQYRLTGFVERLTQTQEA